MDKNLKNQTQESVTNQASEPTKKSSLMELKNPTISTIMKSIIENPGIDIEKILTAYLKENKRLYKNKRSLKESIKDFIYATFMFLRSII